MANPDHVGPFVKPEPRALSKRARKAEDLAVWKAVCKQVDRRDGGRCRACCKRCDPNAVAMLERAHRHHIVYRSAGGEDFDSNVITLCAICHGLQHAGMIDVRGNANYGIELWRNDGAGQWFLSARERAPFIYERD